MVVGVVWFRDHLSIEAASDTGAEAAFEEVRQRYGSQGAAARDARDLDAAPQPASRPMRLAPPDHAARPGLGRATTSSSPASTFRSGCCA